MGIDRRYYSTLLFVVVAVLLASPACGANNRNASRKPRRLIFYQFESRFPITSAGSAIITNATTGFLAAVDEALTEGPNTMSSAVVGRQIGTLSAVFPTSAASQLFLYASFDHRIATKELNGAFLLQGSFEAASPTRVFPVVAGTGDFYLARGFATTSFSSGNATTTTAVTRYDVHFKY